jgi:predicted permease
MFDRLRFEISSAWRSLASTPALTVTALVTLAVTIGVNFAMLGFAHRALNGVPDGVTAPARLFTLAFDHDLRDRRVVMSSTSYPTFVALRDRVRAFSGAAAWRRTSTVAVVGTEQVPVDAVQVSGGYFQVLGTPPRLGRGLVPADDDEAAAFPVAAVSDGFWRRVFHADPEVIGRRMVVGSIDYTIVGVMPPGFSGHTIERADIWVPFAAAMRAEPGWQTQTFRNIASIIVRLADGETPASAAGQAAADAGTPVVFRAVAGADMAPAERRVVLWLTGVSVLVFVIGLANSATLLLVRSVRRRYQMAIRIALGASRARLLGSTIVETALLGATAGALSLLFAGWFETLIHRTLLPKLADASGLNARTAAIGIVAGLVASLAAAIVTGSRLPSSGLSAGVSMRTPSAHRPFLVLQTTLSVVLLAGAGLLGRSLWNLASQDFGFRMADVWLVELDQGSRDLTDPDTFYRTALDRVRALPGVEEASIKQSLPFSSHHVPPMHVPGLAEPPMTNGQLPFMVAATRVVPHPRRPARRRTAAHARRRSRRARRRGEPGARADGVAGRQRSRQVHPGRVRSLLRSLRRWRSSAGADHASVPRGRGRRARSTAAVRRAGRRRRSVDALLRALQPSAGAAGRHPGRARDFGAARSNARGWSAGSHIGDPAGCRGRSA